MTIEQPVLRCSQWAERLGEPAAGTVPQAAGWLLVEQPGPWRAKAIVAGGSDLPASINDSLVEQAETLGLRMVLTRRTGRHSSASPHPRRVIVAWCEPGREMMWSAAFADPMTLASLDLSELAAGTVRLGGQPVDREPGVVVAVCSNGRRDRCCAMLGRPLVDRLAATNHSVFEATHLGGHRFAPTALFLPYGIMLGRLTPECADEATTAMEHGELAAAALDTGVYRGRSWFAGPAQAAEAAVRRDYSQLGLGPDSTVVEAIEDGDLVTCRSGSGRRWKVRVGVGPLDPPRPVSCGKPAEPRPTVAVHSVEEVAAAR